MPPISPEASESFNLSFSFIRMKALNRYDYGILCRCRYMILKCTAWNIGRLVRHSGSHWQANLSDFQRIPSNLRIACSMLLTLEISDVPIAEFDAGFPVKFANDGVLHEYLFTPTAFFGVFPPFEMIMIGNTLLMRQLIISDKPHSLLGGDADPNRSNSFRQLMATGALFKARDQVVRILIEKGVLIRGLVLQILFKQIIGVKENS